MGGGYGRSTGGARWVGWASVRAYMSVGVGGWERVGDVGAESDATGSAPPHRVAVGEGQRGTHRSTARTEWKRPKARTGTTVPPLESYWALGLGPHAGARATEAYLCRHGLGPWVTAGSACVTFVVLEIFFSFFSKKNRDFLFFNNL